MNPSGFVGAIENPVDPAIAGFNKGLYKCTYSAINMFLTRGFVELGPRISQYRYTRTSESSDISKYIKHSYPASKNLK